MPKDPSGGGILEAPGPHVDIKKLAANGSDGVSKAVSDIGNFVKSGGIQDTAKSLMSNPLGFASQVKDSANNIARTASSALVNSIVNNISLYIGQFMYFPSVVVTDVSPTFDVVLSPDGKPMRATVNVGFRTFYVPTENDIENMFSNMTKDDLRGSRLG
jgi:hypothetical protein